MGHDERPTAEAFTAQFCAYLTERGLRATDRRRMVADHLATRGGHVTLQQLTDEIQAADASVGHVTVYRAVRLLEDAGLVERTTLGDVDRYEVAGAHHDHLVCDVCGRVVEFHEEAIERRQRVVAAAHGFRMTDHAHVIHGVCRDCSAAEA